MKKGLEPSYSRVPAPLIPPVMTSLLLATILYLGCLAPPADLSLAEIAWSSPGDSTTTTATAPTVPRQRHTVQFGIAYEPGPGARLFGQYLYVAHPSGFISTEIGWGRQLFGALGYTYVVALDPWGDRHITLTPSVFSEYEPNRLLNGVRTHERRTGGGLHARTQYPLAGGWQYGQDVRAEHIRVFLDPAEGTSIIRDVTTVETTPRLLRHRIAGLLTVDLLLEGRLRAGWDYDDDVAFVQARLGGRWHRPLGAGFSTQTEATAVWTSPRAPEFERATLGGSVTVRGHRRDAALGQSLWSVQQELWIPLPGTVDTAQGVGFLLGQHVRLAAFFDAGGLGGAGTSQNNGVRAGTGLGLRLRLGGITIRADWAHRLPDLEDARFAGAFFISLRPDTSLLLFQ